MKDTVPLLPGGKGCGGRCAVDPAQAHAVAFRLADEAHVFTNPLGLCGTWGRLVHAWLDELLPADAAARCSSGCRVVVTRVRCCGRRRAPTPESAASPQVHRC